MFNQYSNQHNITLDAAKLEPVKKFFYLGQTITMTPGKEIEIQRRIALGWPAFGRANLVLTKKLPMSLKRKVYNQCILPVMTYGSETWNLAKKQTMKLRTTQRSHEKKMLGITWKHKETAKWIREQTKLQDNVKTLKMLKWNWGGNIMRTNDN